MNNSAMYAASVPADALGLSSSSLGSYLLCFLVLVFASKRALDALDRYCGRRRRRQQTRRGDQS